MSTLKTQRRLCDGEMIARFDRDLSGSKPALLLLPGGPGLGSIYLDPFVARLGERLGLPAGILDLPNHGASVLRRPRQLSYAECMDYVAGACRELSGQSKGLIIVGQSFGARLAFDLLAQPKRSIVGSILVGFPYVFQISSPLLDKLSALDLEENVDDETYARNWRKIAPTYASKNIDSNDFEALVSGTKWIGNERMLEVVPDIEAVASQINPLVPLGIFQGEFDPVVPDHNWKSLQTIVPKAYFEVISGVGHFPMIEDQEATLNAFVTFIERSIKQT